MHVAIRLMGGFDVVVDGAGVAERAWRRRSATALVKLLALQPQRRLHRERVIDQLWPDLLVAQAAPRLHTAAHYARWALGRRDAVVLSGDTVSLLPGHDVDVDAVAFERAAASAQTGRPAGEAIALYRGDLLPDDVYDTWTEEPRGRLRSRYEDLLRAAGLEDDLSVGDDPDTATRPLSARRDDDGPIGAGSPTAVPLPATPTVGRDADVARVVGLLERAGTVTLLGPGGVGKSRLAIEAALRYQAAHEVDACFVDLTKTSDPRDVPGLVCAELGVRPGSGGDAEAALREALRRRSLLLVLDNFEHVIDAGALVARLRAAAPDLRVLCTSRTRLRVTGEHLYDVAPLPVGRRPVGPRRGDVPRRSDVPPAVALFAQAARAVDPDFDVAPHLADVAAICRAVDGLPLGIELAAAHVRTLRPAELRARLRGRLATSSGGARDRPARQRTIRATLDWSLQLLEPDERRLFASLGVFAGAVPLAAIERVCGADVVDGLGRLVDQSLVQRLRGPGGELRFRLLSLLREVARELLSADEAQALRARHARYVAAVLEETDEQRWTSDQPWLNRIAELLPEIRPAHEAAESLGDWRTAARITATLATYWHREGHHREGGRWAQDALQHRADLDDLLVARLHIAAGLVGWSTGLLRAREHWTAAVEICRTLGEQRYLAYSLALTAGSYLGEEGSVGLVGRLCDEAVERARAVGELPLISAALYIQGQLARLRGSDGAARDAWEEGRQLARKARDDAHLVVFLAELGHLAGDHGNVPEARRLHLEALAVSWSRGRRLLAAWSVSALAAAELGLGRPERAAGLIGAADEALRALAATRMPTDARRYDAVVGALRAVLGDAGFERLEAAGARLSLAEAVELAQADDRRLPEPGRAPVPAYLS